MILTETSLKGAFIVDVTPAVDERGFFARTYCRREFKTRGVDFDAVQCSVSYNRKRGTLRGLHFQSGPSAEAKIVRCTRGAIYDVIVDLRRESSTYKRWIATELSADNRRAVYLPTRFAHGFQTLTDDVEIYYEMSSEYDPAYACGIAWNDPAIGIEWPVAEPILSGRDQAHPPFAGTP